MKFLFKAVCKHVDDLITDRLIAFHKKMIDGGQIQAPRACGYSLIGDYKVDRVPLGDRSPREAGRLSRRQPA